MLLLQDLAKQITQYAESEKVFGLTYLDVLLNINSNDKDNYNVSHKGSHIERNGLNLRKIPLLGSIEIIGNVLSIDYCEHDNTIKLNVHKSVVELEEFIISPCGILNVFTSLVVPIINGTARQFNISYVDEEGLTVMFDKVEQRQVSNVFLRKYLSPVLTWR